MLAPTMAALIAVSAASPGVLEQGVHPALIVGGEAVVGAAAGLLTMVAASVLIVAANLGSPTTHAASFALLAVAPPLAVGVASWTVGRHDPRARKSLGLALAGAYAGQAIAVAAYFAALHARRPTPATETAVGLIILSAGGPLLAAAGATIALEVFGEPVTVSASGPAVVVRF